MKKKIIVCVSLFVMAFFLTSCGDLLSVVTKDDNGGKKVMNYISLVEDTVYDESASMKTWRELELFDDEYGIKQENLLFQIENKKENIVVLGNDEVALEFKFFDGGYNIVVYSALGDLEDLSYFSQGELYEKNL